MVIKQSTRSCLEIRMQDEIKVQRMILVIFERVEDFK